jgi:hypothetical protein
MPTSITVAPAAIQSPSTSSARPSSCVVWELARPGLAEGEMDRVRKAHLLGVLNLAMGMDGQAMPLGLALHRAAASLATSFAQRRMLLRLPENATGLPEAIEAPDAAAAPPAA